MPMDIGRHDIGAEIISILTKGMYPDPKDALREYVQNGVDAGAKNIKIKIRSNSIIVEDDGSGMSKETIRKAVRLGISDKNPKVDVGFRGIGIYSSFHLCDELRIYSKLNRSGSKPNLLIYKFGQMRNILLEQQQLRFANKIDSSKLIDLQTILKKNIDIYELETKDFPDAGTRVEMVGLDKNFFTSLSNFDDVSEYLRETVPLKFDKENFEWSEIIEKKIKTICRQHKVQFNLINLELQVNETVQIIYRPYVNETFSNTPNKPIFKEIKKDGHFFGVSWGCLNPSRDAIKDRDLRGFVIRKQGFSIGKRSDIQKYFGRPVFFNRYVGEFIIINQDLLPNAARTDFEVSPLRTALRGALSDVAKYFNEEANKFQEDEKAIEEINNAIKEVKTLNVEIQYHLEQPEKLITDAIILNSVIEKITGRIKRKSLGGMEKEANRILRNAKKLRKIIDNAIRKEARGKKGTIKEAIEIAKTTPEAKQRTEQNPPSNLIEVIQLLDIQVGDELKIVLQTLDELFIQTKSKNKNDYLLILKDIKNQIEQNL